MDSERRALYHNRSAIEMSFNMVARIDNTTDLAGMRSAGKKAAAVLDMIGPYVQPGVTTDYLNQLCHEYIVDELQCIPAPLNYGGGGGQAPFPKSICTSVNQVGQTTHIFDTTKAAMQLVHHASALQCFFFR